MGVGNYSVEAAIIENGKPVTGTLMLFRDEYSFGSTRKSVNWEYVSCEQSTVKIKAFLRVADRSAVVFNFNGDRGQQFVLEQAQMNTLLSKVKEFADAVRTERLDKEEKERREEEERKHQIVKEQRIREEARLKAEEEYRQKQEAERRKKQEAERQANEAIERKKTEKKGKDP